MAVTRLGLHGGPRRAYAAFTDRSTTVAYTQTFTRLGLYGGPRRARGGFSSDIITGVSATAYLGSLTTVVDSSATFIIDSVDLSQRTTGTIQISKGTAGTISVAGGLNGNIDFNTDITG